MCGRAIIRKTVVGIVIGSLEEIFSKVDYKRIFPNAKDKSSAMWLAREMDPRDKEFMVFKLE